MGVSSLRRMGSSDFTLMLGVLPSTEQHLRAAYHVNTC